ncbi:MAG: type IV secretion system DNA-binding domain-containing protein [Dissulfurispiraceae bacterium]
MSIGELSNKNIHRKDQMYKGAESAWTDVKMSGKNHMRIALVISLEQCLLVVVLNVLTTARAWGNLARYVMGSICSLEVPWGAGGALIELLTHNLWLLVITAPVWCAYPVVIKYFKNRASAQAEKQYEAGAKKVTEDELIEQVKKSGKKTDLVIGRVPLPWELENEHAFVVGSPGKGKTVANNQIISRLEERGAKALIYDFKGDYVQHFYKEGRDIIFNPLDVRSIGWTITNEAKFTTDVDSIAGSLIPQSISNQDPFWADAARDVFTGILHYLYQNGKTSNKDIWEMVTSPVADIAAKLKKTKGAERGYVYIQDASSKQAMSVISVMTQYTKSFEYMATADGPFCIKDWLEDGKPGFLFVTNYSNLSETLRPVLSLLVDLMGTRLLAMSEDLKRRIFFIIDEFGTLQRLPTIVKMLTEGRSKGGSIWIWIQDIGQVDKIYTKDLRQSVFGACGFNLFFSVNDPDTGKFIEAAIGKWRYIDSEETRTMGSADERDGITIMRRKVTEDLFLAADIKNLPKLTAILRIPGFDVAEIKLQYKPYPVRAESFVMKPGFSLEAIRQQAEAARELEALETKDKEQKPSLRDKIKNKKKVQEKESEKPEKGEDLEGDIFMAGD